MKIAIFGGAFDPVHYGHLLLAETALQQCGLDRVVWVPACAPPHKSQQLLAFQHRLEMVRRAIADHPAFTVSDIEATQTGVSYAIATFHALQIKEPAAQWFWIIGIDAFEMLPRWYRSAELIPQCTWLVAPRGQKAEGKAEGRGQKAEGKDDGEMARWRDGEQFHPSQQPTNSPLHHPTTLCHQIADQMADRSVALRWELLQMPLVDISSRLIRQYCRQGRSLRYLVPEEIRQYITVHKLYQIG
jgi:nicotinate-nucleotide adenylyltransferase